MELFEQLTSGEDSQIRRRRTDSPIPLTVLQRVTWNYLTDRARLSQRLRAASFWILGPLDTGVLRACLEAVIQRHESLRTRIFTDNGALRQHIDSPSAYDLKQINLCKMDRSSASIEAGRLAQGFLDEKIDLSVGPLLDVVLFKISGLEYVLVIGLDHIVSDNVSCEILKREIWNLYGQASRGVQFSLPELPIQFADYAVWQQQEDAGWVTKHADYWRGRLVGTPLICRSWLEEAEEPPHTLGSILHVPFGRGLTAGLKALAEREQRPLPLVVLAVYILGISRWRCRREFVLGFTTHGRHHQPELHGMIGCLAYHLYLRIEVPRRSSFIDLLMDVSREFYAAREHSDCGRLCEMLPGCLSSLVFNWLSTRWTQTLGSYEEKLDGIKIFPFGTKWRISPLELYAFFSETAAGIGASIYFRNDIFPIEDVNRFGESLRSLASQVVENPLALVSSGS